MGEVEKNSFIALPGKERHSQLMPSKLCVPIPGWGVGGCYEEFYSQGLLIRLRVRAGLTFLQSRDHLAAGDNG